MGVSPSGPRHIVRVLSIWFVCTVLGLLALVLLGPHLAEWGILPPVASDRAGDVDSVLFLFTLLSIPVFTFVVVFGIYSARAFRSQGRPVDGPMTVVHPRYSPIWLIVSVVLVIFLYVFGLYFLNAVQASAGPSALEVHVNGEQWLWNYTYAQYNNVGSTELELPVNRPVNFDHHLYRCAALLLDTGVRHQAGRGAWRGHAHFSATPNAIGNYVVRCAELCGVYHAYMETPVHVVTRVGFRGVGRETAAVCSGWYLAAGTADGAAHRCAVGIRRCRNCRVRRVGNASWRFAKLFPSYLTGAVLAAMGISSEHGTSRRSSASATTRPVRTSPSRDLSSATLVCCLAG